MPNLIPFNNDGLELLIDTTTGESFASIRAVARLTDKSTSTIHSYVNGGLKTVRQMTLKTAEIHTTTGLKTVRLLNEDQMIEVIKRYKPSLLEELNKPALRMYLHHIAGYEVTSSAIEKPPEHPDQGLLNEVHKSTKRKCKSDYHADLALHHSLEVQKELDPQYASTVRASLFIAGLRLELEPDDDMEHNKCGNMIVKQFRRTQMTLEGVESVADHLLTQKERKDKQRALELNPSSKEGSLPKISEYKLTDKTPADLKTLKNPTRYGNIEQQSLIQGTSDSSQPSLPEGFIIDIPLDNIH